MTSDMTPDKAIPEKAIPEKAIPEKAITDKAITEKAPETKSPGPPKRHWHRRPGQKIDDLLLKRHQRYTPLARLLTQSEQRESLTRAVRALLPDVLAEAISVVNYRPPALILRVSNASFATRLRYQLPELTTKLRNLADFDGLLKINLRVVQTIPRQMPEKKARYLPHAAARSLAELASTLENQPNYLGLQKTILRLSEHKPPKSLGSAGSDEGNNAEPED